MDSFINVFPIETYNCLLKLYQSLQLDYKKNPLIRKSNNFYNCLEEALFPLSSDKIKFYILRDITSSSHFLRCALDYEYFYQLSISRINDNVVISLNSLLKPSMGDINVTIMLVDMLTCSCLKLNIGQEFEIFIPQTMFKLMPNVTYFKMILNRTANSSVFVDGPNIISSDISADVDLEAFHNIFPFLVTDVEYLEVNLDLITNELYRLLDYFSYTYHTEFIENYYRNSNFGKNSSKRLLEYFYFINFQIIENEKVQDVRFVYVEELTEKFISNEYINTYIDDKRQTPCWFLKKETKNPEISTMNISYSLRSLKKDLVTFSKLLLYCRAIKMYNEQHDTELTILFQLNFSSAKNKYLRKSIEEIYHYDFIQEFFVKALATLALTYLNKFSLESTIEEVFLLIQKRESLNCNNFKTPKAVTHTNEMIRDLIEWLTKHIDICENSITYHNTLICQNVDMKLNELMQAAPPNQDYVTFFKHRIDINSYSLFYYDNIDDDDIESSIDFEDQLDPLDNGVEFEAANNNSEEDDNSFGSVD